MERIGGRRSAARPKPTLLAQQVRCGYVIDALRKMVSGADPQLIREDHPDREDMREHETIYQLSTFRPEAA